MTFYLLGPDDVPLIATIELEDDSLILKSRGGTIGAANETNRDYGKALRLILEKICATPECGFSEILVDSSKVRHLPTDRRRVLTADDIENENGSVFSLVSRRMQKVGRAPESKAKHGNANRRIRILFPGKAQNTIIGHLGLIPQSQNDLTTKRLTTQQMNSVNAEHIFQAINEILRKEIANNFHDSTKYDLISAEGERLPPKAVFGRAASIALGIDIGPYHFSSGGTCFQILERYGYEIVPKGASIECGEDLTFEDRSWTEGNTRLVSHLKKERGRGLAAAKKAAFMREHGKLFCENCGLDPVEAYKSHDAEACIEVHHQTVYVSNMAEGHQTKLSDLQCLCANCHRFEHRRMKKSHLESR